MKLGEKYLKIVELLLANNVLPRGYNTRQFNRFIKLVSLLKLEIPLVKSISTPSTKGIILDELDKLKVN